MDIKIPHNKPTLGNDDFYTIKEVLKSNWVVDGPKVKEFEKQIASFVGTKYAIATNSGTSSLHLSLLALDVGKGDEVIIPSYVCSALLNAINYVGAKPIIVDVNIDDFNISFESVNSKINKKTKAIILPHIYGTPCDISLFEELEIPIIEDLAQSIGAKYGRKRVGSFFNCSITSFYGSKLITTGQGGMVLTNLEEIYDSTKDLIECDCRETYKIRYNYKMTDISAALGLCQFAKLQQFLERRAKIASYYDESFEDLPIRRQEIVEPKENVFFRYVIVLENEVKVRKLQHYLLRKGIKTIVPIENYELLHNYLHLDKSYFSISERISKTTLSMPIFPSLTDDELYYIVDSVISFFKGVS